MELKLGESQQQPSRRCPVLFLTGALASHNHTVFRLYNAVLSAVRNDPNLQGKVELIQLDNVANVLSEQVRIMLYL
ncbi:unnamed protein product [Schistosoma margrebowiei]|uniref:Uncharacterized protein n=1 Tax=Schistosoma margrebowiei TaxID=48269 RepID=A0A183M6J2_9TREM|nr:unnamed protein product [Schistosoma margrebowiei]